MDNDKLISLVGCGISTASLILGLVAIFNDKLIGGIILGGASLIIFLLVLIIYLRRHQIKDLLKNNADTIIFKHNIEIQNVQKNLNERLDKLTILTRQADLSPFQDIPCELFYNHIECNDLSAINIFAHTGAALIEPLFSCLEESEEKRNILKNIPIRILIRNPKAEIGRRTIRINQTIQRIRDYQKKGFNLLLLQFYEDLPTFRSIVCLYNNSKPFNRKAFLSYYYFPTPDGISRKYPRALIMDESESEVNDLINIYESWFNYFWGKNKNREQKIHTLILDFDDTLVNSHDIQIEAWLDLIEEAQTKFGLKPTDFNEQIKAQLSNPEQLKKKIRSIFFLKQDAKLIFPEIFTQLDSDRTDTLHQRRFEIREKKVREQSQRLPLFSNCLTTLTQLAEKYNLIIVSATDENMIINHLSSQRLPVKTPAGKENLYELFRYVFGKREHTFDWKNMKRKSQLMIKIINILGIPLERMIYIGDNNGDFMASMDIGIQFIEARLFSNEVFEAIGQKTLISTDKERYHFTDWMDFQKILDKIETMPPAA